jgi:hypothetical protein
MGLRPGAKSLVIDRYFGVEAHTLRLSKPKKKHAAEISNWKKNKYRRRVIRRCSDKVNKGIQKRLKAIDTTKIEN